MTAGSWQDAKEFIARLAAKPRFGLFSDLDGTLSPIAPTPEAAQITKRNRELLVELQKELPLIGLISGRRAGSLHSRVGLEGLVYIGNHGLERWTDNGVQVLAEAQPYIGALQEVKNELQKIEEPGAYVEDKGPTLSLHYRQAAQPIAFARDKAAWIAEVVEKRGLVLFTGKMVFEVRPPVEMDKGIAFQQLIKENDIEAALFLGDDISDLNALRTARKMRGDGISDAWGVGVQSEEAPVGLAAAADFLADGVDEVEELLAWVLKARKASST
jgi:trehalose 6-phosphate phosphatase